MSKLAHYDLSCKVLEAAFEVHRALGSGLLESAYEGAYCVELSHMGVSYERQQVFPVVYRGEYVGAYFADIVVANTIIVGLKSVKALNEVMKAQVINYLKLSVLPVAYLINFNGLRVEWMRFVNLRDG
jgi:GxxExxY protein